MSDISKVKCSSKLIRLYLNAAPIPELVNSNYLKKTVPEKVHIF